MKAGLWGVLALTAAGCVPTPSAERTAAEIEVASYRPPPAGYPPRMGSISGTLGGRTVAWETFDFSIGAYDASASVGYLNGQAGLRLLGHVPGDPDSKEGNILVTGAFQGAPASGSLKDVGIEIRLGPDGDGPVLSSKGQPATLQLEALQVSPESGYGRGSGLVEARLCPTQGASGPCQDLSASFDTEIQFDTTRFTEAAP